MAEQIKRLRVNTIDEQEGNIFSLAGKAGGYKEGSFTHGISGSLGPAGLI